MNAAETIAAAIEKLEHLKGTSTDGPWVDEYSGEAGACVVPADAESTREAVAQLRLLPAAFDAELIATLHRTIDAQLAILRRHYDIAWVMGKSYPVSYEDFGVLDLARAILGEVS